MRTSDTLSSDPASRGPEVRRGYLNTKVVLLSGTGTWAPGLAVLSCFLVIYSNIRFTLALES